MSHAPAFDRAQRTIAIVMLVVATDACRGARTDREINATYGTTGKLELLVYDSNGNGKPDTWSYMDGTSVVRIEIDTNEDGAIDRWEHYGADRALERVGTSSANSGKPDTWTYAAADGTTARVERSTRPDGSVTRREFYEHGILARAEEDADGNGAVDRWETYVNGVVSAVAFDLEGAGRPTRRLVYDGNGESARIEVDRE